MADGRFRQFLSEHEGYTVAKSTLLKLVDEAVDDFPKEPTFFDKLAVGTDIFLVYTGKVEAWRKRWFGV